MTAARQGHWRLAGERHLRRPVRHAADASPANGTTLNTPGNTAFANLNGENTVLGGLGPGQLYFDPAVYSQPAAGVQGNMTRNSGPEGPGFWELDGSLFKRFSVGGNRFAEIRLDAYNVTNSVRWGNPAPASALPPATPSARSPGPPAASAACASARGSCFKAIGWNVRASPAATGRPAAYTQHAAPVAPAWVRTADCGLSTVDCAS